MVLAEALETGKLTLVALLSLATWRTGTLPAHVITRLRRPAAALLAAVLPILTQGTDWNTTHNN